MRLSDKALGLIALMVVGDNPLFPYRSSSYITAFFRQCNLDFRHDGSTRARWTQDVLRELNNGIAPHPDLPSSDILRVIEGLFDPLEFESTSKELKPALTDLNAVLKHHGLIAYLDDANRCHVRSSGTGTSSAQLGVPHRPLSLEEREQRDKVASFLDQSSEDTIIQRLLVPLFQRLGFRRVSAPGHKEKALEFGKDLWMKFQLPTGHWLYFCAQVKRDKIDASASGGDKNASQVLAQAAMAIDHPLFDPDINRKVLLDHIFIISASEITRAARAWIVEKLDIGQRRHLIFMDRDDLLDHAARILVDLNLEQDHVPAESDIPF